MRPTFAIDRIFGQGYLVVRLPLTARVAILRASSEPTIPNSSPALLTIFERNTSGWLYMSSDAQSMGLNRER
jgi:hypothetical protein